MKLAIVDLLGFGRRLGALPKGRPITANMKKESLSERSRASEVFR